MFQIQLHFCLGLGGDGQSVVGACAGERTLSGTLMQPSTRALAGLESLRAFTSPAQLALLQQLTAKADSAGSVWLQVYVPVLV